ncbi:MAG: hypothetical protein K2O42_08975, partial [Oscillospiraceae bacterium]|nr:hypothetical protein [Oscillospiraceae bacterium]
SMTADTVLDLTADGDPQKITRLLKDIRGVNAVSESKEISPGRNFYQVELQSESVRDEIVSVLLANQCSIVEIKLAKLSLEQVFLKLTSQGKKRSSLQELLSEMPDQPANPYDQEV